ncbi:MAG: chloride channel protein [Clostridia bacterium]|nr:chloride channel protein [Clostridia bacterium]MBP3650635.1 chloride channel protein [Clostridia bacterium]
MNAKHTLISIRNYAFRFLMWLLAACLIGCLCGVAGGLFAMAVEWATHFRGAHGWLLYLLPLGGLLIAALYRWMNLPSAIGTDRILETVRSQDRVPILLVPAIFASTVITHLLGGSAGREGAALQLGGTIGAAVGCITQPDPKKDDRRICELCGMAALFSALFGTPMTAAVFVLEIIEVGKFNTRGLLPCMVSSIAAFLMARLIGAPAEAFPLASGLAQVNALTALQTAGLGVIFAVMAILFCIVMHKSGKWLRRLLPNDFLRIALGGVAIIALSLLTGCRDYNGGGAHTIVEALAGHAKPEAFALKLLFTAITLSAGFKGGEIVPSFFVGSTLGCVAAPLLGLPAALGAGLGLVGVFCGVTNAPLASLMLSIELFGSEYLPLFGITAAVSFMLSGHFSLYHSQLFIQRKLGENHETLPVADDAILPSATPATEVPVDPPAEAPAVPEDGEANQLPQQGETA